MEPDVTIELRKEGDGYAPVRLQRNTRYRLVVHREPLTLRIVLGTCDTASTNVSDRPEVYKLWSHDGAYERELAVKDAGQLSGHHYLLEFPELLPNREYSLACDYHGDGVYDRNVFERVPYTRLRRQCAEGDRAQDVRFEPPDEAGEPLPDDAKDAIASERDEAKQGGPS